MLLPPADDAAAWFVETARTAVRSGTPLDPDAVRLLMSLAPGDPIVAEALDALGEDDGDQVRPDATLADVARAASARLREAAATRDQASARETVTALETEVLRTYRPSDGLGRFEDDIAVALAMVVVYDVGADEAHLMMAEELTLGALRRGWERRGEHGLAVNCEFALVLAAIAERTGNAEYRDRAREVMSSYATTYRELGVRAAPYVSALRMI